MANNARFIVNNFLNKKKTESKAKAISVKSQRLKQEKVHKASEAVQQWQGHLPDTDTELVVQLPKEVDLKNVPIKIQSGVDLTITYSRTKSTLTLKIAPNDLLPELPLTVNVSLGEEEQPVPPPPTTQPQGGEPTQGGETPKS